MTADEERERFHRARALFDTLCDLSDRERSERLDELGREDESLAAQVRELLIADGHADRRMRGSAAEALGLESAAAQDLRLPGLELGDVIGVGGVGVVHAARQTKPEREVAVKLLRPGWVTRQSLRRFEDEARVLGWLSHPGIATVFDAGQVETPAGPQPFLVMERVHGERVDLYADRVGLGTEDRLRLVRDIAKAVHHAHQKGVVHRDLKPANILVDEAGQVKVLDFGIARILDSDCELTRNTGVGEILGTLPYMSPEQVRADPAEIDIRVDVYAIGVLGYQLLTGRVPHELDGLPMHEAMRVLLDEEAKPLDTLRPDLRGDVATLVHKALAKEGERRYASCEDLAQDIERFLHHEPIQAVPPSRTYLVRKFARRNRLVLAATAAVFVALLAGLSLALFGLGRAVEERDQADLALRESERASSFLAGLLTEVSPVKSGQDVRLREVLDGATARIGIDFASEPRVAARLHAMVGSTYAALGEVKIALENLEQAYRLSREADSLLDHRQRYAFKYGGALREAGRFEEAHEVLTEALVLLGDDASEPDVRAGVLHQLGVVTKRVGGLDQAEPYFRQAIALTEQHYGRDHELTLISSEGLAILMCERGELAKAQPILEELVERHERVFGQEDVRTIMSYYNLATLYALRGWTGKALEMDERILDARVSQLGREHPESADAMIAVGQGYAQLRRYDEARDLFEEGSAVLEAHLGANHPRILAARGSIGLVCSLSGDLEAAHEVYSDLVVAYTEASGPTSADTLRTRIQVGLTLGKAERYDEALASLRAVLPDCEDALGVSHRTTVSCRVDIGKVLLWADRPDEARSEFEAARAAADASSAYEGAQATIELAKLCLDSDAPRALALAREGLIDVTRERRAWNEVLARAHFANGDVAEALAIHETLPELLPAMDPEERRRWSATGDAYRAALQGDRE